MANTYSYYRGKPKYKPIPVTDAMRAASERFVETLRKYGCKAIRSEWVKDKYYIYTPYFRPTTQCDTARAIRKAYSQTIPELRVVICGYRAERGMTCERRYRTADNQVSIKI